MAFSHSFVVPSHNQAQYLGATLDSLLAQGGERSEIVVSEDHSADGSLALAERYAAAHPGRIKVTRPPEHRGMAPNWNWGVSQAAGEWVSIMGADDLALPGFAAAIREGAALAADAVVVTGNYDYIDGEGRLLRAEKVLSVKEIARPPETLHTQVAAVKVHPAAHAFRRAHWQAVGGFPEALRLYGDWGLWLNLSPRGAFVHVNRTIAQYRVGYRPGIAAARQNEAFLDELHVQMELVPRLAREIPGVDADLVLRERRRRFRFALADAAKNLPPERRGDSLDLLRPWAEDLGETALLERYAAGGDISRGWRGSAARRVLRDIYKRFR